MQKQNILFILCLGGILLLASCAKEGPTGPTGPVGPSLSGSISGHVKLYDMYGSSVLTGLSSVHLYLNTSTVAQNPDANGYYLFNPPGATALVTGNYSIYATDSAYGSTSKNNIQLVAG